MLQERHLRTRLVVEWNRLVENGEVSGLLEICHRAENQPHRVVVEASSDVVVAPFAERLVLMVATAVRELRGSDVDDALACPFRYLVHETDKVLVRVAETHSAADAALEERGTARHVEGHHALVLVPDVHHPFQSLLLRSDAEDGQEAVPIAPERIESGIDLIDGIVARNQFVRRLLVDERTDRHVPGGNGRGRSFFVELLLLRVLDVTQLVNEVAALARSERHCNAV